MGFLYGVCSHVEEKAGYKVQIVRRRGGCQCLSSHGLQIDRCSVGCKNWTVVSGFFCNMKECG